MSMRNSVHPSRWTSARLMLVLPLFFMLAACGDNGIEGERQWMAQVRQQTRVTVPKIAEPKTFTPFVYGGKDQVDPFNPAKLAIAMAKQQTRSNSAFKPDLSRRREALEAFPLDAMDMVGTLRKKGENYALIRADHAIYRARVGNYIGQNFGKIAAISDTEVDINEVVQDASGEWVERKAKLELQETKK